MANKALDIIVKVRDAASGKLREINKSLDDTGKAVKKTSVDFTEFNRTMFSATAFAGFFTRAFSNFGTLITEGAQLDRVQTQFERVLGPSGALFQAIKGLTGTAIDRVEAMKAGIALKTLGIGKDLGQVAEFIARSGEAAKMAGLDAAEGVKHFTAFVKTGRIENLEFLNLIRGSDPAFKMQMALLERVGGVFGSALTAQEKYNRGIALLRMATRNMSKDNRDLVDITTELGQSFKFFKGEIGTFLGTALSPLLVKLGDLFDAWSIQLQQIRKNDKDLLFLGRAFLYVAGTVSALVAVLGTLRLAVKGLSFVGVGVPALVKWMAVLAAGFIGLTHNADKLSDKITGPFDNLLNRLKLIGGFFRGISQLFQSFFEPDNFVRGIGKIDTALYNMLDQAGLLGFATALARVAIMVKVFGQSVIEQVVLASKWINDKLGGAFEKVLTMLGLSKGAGQSWSRVLIDNTNGVHKALARLTAAFIGLWAASKVFKSVGGLLSNIPIVGRLFGGGSGRGGPKGTRSDPIYTKDISSGAILKNSNLAIKAFDVIKKVLGRSFIGRAATSVAKMNLPFVGNVGTLFENMLTKPLGSLKELYKLRGLAGIFGSVKNFAAALVGRIPEILALWIIIKAGIGIFKSLYENFQNWKSFGSSVIGWLSSAFLLAKAKIEEFFTNLPDILSGMWDSVKSAGADAWSGLKGFFQEHFGAAFEGISEKVKAGMGWLDEFTRVTPVISQFRSAMEDTGKFIKEMFLAIFTGILGVIKNIPLVGDTVEWAFKSLTDFAGGMAGEAAKGINRSAMGMDLSTIQTTGVVTKSLLPETSDGRQQFLQQAATDMYAVDKDKGAGIARAMREAMADNYVSPEEFASALGARLDAGVGTQAAVQTAKEVQKQNNKPTFNNQARRGGCG